MEYDDPNADHAQDEYGPDPPEEDSYSEHTNYDEGYDSYGDPH